MRSAVRGRIVGHTTRVPTHPPPASRAPTSAMAVNTRLRRSADVRAAFADGTAAHGRAVVVHYRERDSGPGRWTVVAGRKVGNAVARNRAKRRLRAVLRGVDLPRAADLVVVARVPALHAGFDELESEVRRLVERAAGDVTADPGRTEAMA